SPHAPSRFSDRSRVRVLIPNLAAVWLVSFTTGLNLARLSSSTAIFQSAAVAGLVLSVTRHISGNFTYLFMPPSVLRCAPAPRSGPTFPGCLGDRPCTDRGGEQFSRRCQARSRPIPRARLRPLPLAWPQRLPQSDQSAQRSAWRRVRGCTPRLHARPPDSRLCASAP